MQSIAVHPRRAGRDYPPAVDREAMARAARRRQAQDALTFEREREAMLIEQLEDVLGESDGSRVDEAAFAAMEPEAVSLVRALLDSGEPEVEDEFGNVVFDEPDEADEAVLREQELTRLEEVLEECRRKQRALEQYLAALDMPR
jgi:hypothetical protein